MHVQKSQGPFKSPIISISFPHRLQEKHILWIKSSQKAQGQYSHLVKDNSKSFYIFPICTQSTNSDSTNSKVKTPTVLPVNYPKINFFESSVNTLFLSEWKMAMDWSTKKTKPGFVNCFNWCAMYRGPKTLMSWVLKWCTGLSWARQSKWSRSDIIGDVSQPWWPPDHNKMDFNFLCIHITWHTNYSNRGLRYFHWYNMQTRASHGVEST